MSHQKLSLLKLKKKCQTTLYKSIEEVLDLEESQTYLPAFTQTLKFESDFSKKMFILNSKYILLKLKNEDSIPSQKNPEEDNKNRLHFKINESLQGNVRGYIVNHKLYQKSKCYEDYERFVAEIPMFLKCNPLIDVISYMEGKYDFKSSIPSVFSMMTNKKINDIHNNAYLEVICAYYLNLLQENKRCTLFPNFYGAFNGIAKNYSHDISEDYPHIRNCSWFEEKNEKLNYEIVRNNNLEDYQALSFRNIQKIDYTIEKDNQYKKSKEDEINAEIIQPEESYISSNFDLLDNTEDLEIVEWDLVKKTSNNSCLVEIENLDPEIDDELDILDENNSDEDDSWSSISSDGSCIFSETYVKLEKFPVQILAMERLEITLTDLAKKDLSLEEWKSVLFEICFGMSVAQKVYGFIHNDLHSDNIMFKKCVPEFKYYQIEDTYYKIPTHKRETKIIDFARGIIKVGKKTYFSDVFRKEGDAGGQYQYLNLQKRKKFNFHFDLARLATTIREFTQDKKELVEIDKILLSWCLNKNGDSFLEMDDDFSLYVEIAETANNSLPIEQMKHKIFNSWMINPNEIPNNTHIYQY